MASSRGSHRTDAHRRTGRREVQVQTDTRLAAAKGEGEVSQPLPGRISLSVGKNYFLQGNLLSKEKKSGSLG